MAAIGRNEVCPCGSGRKYKKCCLAAKPVGGYTREERARSVALLRAFADANFGPEDDAAYDELVGENLDRWLDAADPWSEVDQAFHDAWFFFDHVLPDGRTVADHLAASTQLSAGERRYLEHALPSCVRLYEVIDTRPGLSVTLREVLDGERVTVRERTASRMMSRADLVAARILARGASGEPEIEMGALSIPGLIRHDLVATLSVAREEFLRRFPDATQRAFWKHAAPVFFQAWVSCVLDPPVPALRNTDGEPLVLTRVYFEVRDPARVRRELDASLALQRDAKDPLWTWSRKNPAGATVTLGTLTLSGSDLVLDVNSADRASRGRALVEALCAGSIAHRATSHEDPTQEIQRRLREAPDGDVERSEVAGVPAEVIEDLVLGKYATHYRAWIDEPVPALDGKTPREAATTPRLRATLERLIREIEGMYQRALRSDEPAYDPSWMWEELGLVDAGGSAQRPPLHHERMAQRVEGFDAFARSVAARLRGPTGLPVGTFTRQQLDVDLDVRRFLRDATVSGPEGAMANIPLAEHLACAINFEVWRRKVFWVDASLAFLLARTDIDVLGRELRLPFDCIALVFTDRHVLSLAERLLAREPGCALRGSFLRVATVYLTEETVASGRSLRIVFALDALGADLPYLYEHSLMLSDEAPIELPPAGDAVTFSVGDRETVVPPQRPLRGLVQVVLNAVLYATSAGVEPRAHPRARPSETAAPEAPPTMSDEVCFLPGTIPISRLRQMQDLERAPGGRGLLHRFLVRGHWRRPSAGWKDQRMRWIEPYWKGPDLAAVIERAYTLKA